MTTDADWTVLAVNPALERLVGRPAAELEGRSMGALLTRAGAFVHQARYAPRLLAEGTVHEMAVEVLHADGTRIPVLLASALVRDAAAAPAAHVTAVVPVAQRRDHERELQHAQRRLEAAYRELERIHVFTRRLSEADDRADVVACVAEVVAGLGGRAPTVWLREDGGRGFRSLDGRPMPPPAPDVRTLPLGPVGAPVAHLSYAPPEAEVQALIDLAAATDPERVLQALLDGAAQALTRIALVEQLGRQALTDELTGLDNRRALVRAAAGVLEERRRSPCPLTVLYLDLDGFKAVNDRLGHAAGDDVLVAVAEALRSALRGSDLVARLGGDEFAALVRGHAGVREARALAHRVEREVAARLAGVGVTASVGVLHLGAADVATGVEDLLHRADAAMYGAKRRRRR